MTGVFEILAHEDHEGTTIRRQALALANKRVNERFDSFLRVASGDLEARLALIKDDFNAVVAAACDEVGFADATAVQDTLWSERTAAGEGGGSSGEKTASTEKEARRPKLCPYHSEVVDASLAAGDPGAGYSAMAQHAWGEKHCQSDEWDGGRCSFKPQMTTQSFWDDKKAESEKRREERQQQAEQAEVSETTAPEGEIEEPAVGESEPVAEAPETEAEVIEVDFGGEAEGPGLTEDALMEVAASAQRSVPLALKTADGQPYDQEAAYLGPDYATRGAILQKFNERFPGLTVNGEPYGPQHTLRMNGNPEGFVPDEGSWAREPVEFGHPDERRLQALRKTFGPETHPDPREYLERFRGHLGSVKTAEDFGDTTEAPAPPAQGEGDNSGQAIVEPNHGLHNGPVALLAFLDASVNGLAARQQGRDIVGTYSPFNRQGWEQIKSEPVTVSVPHPEYLPVAIAIIQNGREPARSGPEIKELAQRMHAGEVPFPPGVSPDQVKIGRRQAAPNELQKGQFTPGLSPAGSPPTPPPASTPPAAPSAQDIHHEFAMLHAGEPGGQAGQYNGDRHTQENYNQVAQNMGIDPSQVQQGLQNFYTDKGYHAEAPADPASGPAAMASPDVGALNLPSGTVPAAQTVTTPHAVAPNQSLIQGIQTPPPQTTVVPQNPADALRQRVQGAVEKLTTGAKPPTGDSTEERTTVEVDEGPEPKIDKRKWTPENLQQRLETESENSPHRTVRQDVVHDLNDPSRPNNQDKPDQIGENLTERQDITQDSGFSGGPANERTWTNGPGSAVQ